MSDPSPNSSESQFPLLPLLVCVCAVLVAVGSLNPWARVLFISVRGTEGDGMLTLILALAAGAIAVVRLARPNSRWPMFLVAAIFGVCAVIGIRDWVNVADVAADADAALFDAAVEVGWGLVVVALASVAGALLSISAAFVPDVLTDNPVRPAALGSHDLRR